MTIGFDDAVLGRVDALDVPGGSLVVTLHPGSTADLTGPAVLVAEGTLDAAWLKRYAGPPEAPVSDRARVSAPVSPA